MKHEGQFYTIDGHTGSVVARQLQHGNKIQIGVNGRGIHVYDYFSFCYFVRTKHVFTKGISVHHFLAEAAIVFKEVNENNCHADAAITIECSYPEESSSGLRIANPQGAEVNFGCLSTNERVTVNDGCSFTGLVSITIDPVEASDEGMWTCKRGEEQEPLEARIG